MNILQIVSNAKVNGPTQVAFFIAKELVAQGHQMWIASADGEMRQRFDECGVWSCEIPIQRLEGSLLACLPFYITHYFSAYKTLDDLICEHGIQLIHTHTPIANILGRELSKKHSIPYITTAHNLYVKSLKNDTYCWGDTVVAVSDKVRENCIQTFGTPAEKVVEIRNGIDLDALEPNDPVCVPNGFIIGTICGLRKQKALDNLLRSFALFHDLYSDSKLVICGEGAERSFLESLTKELGLQADVIFPGFIKGPGNALCRFDVFAMSSSFEGLPLALVEAMSMGVPCVATDVGGVSEVVDGSNGILIDYGDNEAMARAFCTLYENPKLRREISIRGLETAKGFSCKGMAEKYCKVYRKAIENQ